MRPFFQRPVLVTVVLLVVIGIGGALIFFNFKKPPAVIPVVEPPRSEPRQEVIGKSVEGRDIISYRYGTGTTEILFVGGIHGGYEWNSTLLAYRFMDYLGKNRDSVPNDLTITVIPSANPDGLYAVIGKEGRFSLSDVSSTTKEVLEAGRFNSNQVDLNRNFDCNWEPTSTWKSKKVNAGTAPFSEPEAAALRDFVLKNNPRAVIFWHSQANAVYASECNAGILPETLDVMNAYSEASGYPAIKSFDSYKVTGDAEGWLASINIPAITVEMKTHETIEWDKNLSGIKALFAYFGRG